MRMERPDFGKAFLQSSRTGFYLLVLEVGEIGAGDAISLVFRETDAPTVVQMTRRLYGSGGRPVG
jgi:MOSC domain-containing protein YiiM